MSVARDLLRRLRCHGAPVLLASALALSACGGDDQPDDTTAALECAVTTTEQASAPALDLSGQPPTELAVQQLAEPPSPDCPQAVEGDVVAVDYVGRAWSTGEVFDSSADRGPFTFQLGAGRVIPGWDEGIAGLQVGERARLVIPPELAYGESGAGPAIGPNETLVFDVQLVDIIEQPTGEATEG